MYILILILYHYSYYIPLFALLAIGIPVFIPYYYWSENFWIAFWVCFTLRFITTLNIAFFVNSVAHMFGNRPYDKYDCEMQIKYGLHNNPTF